MFRQLLTNEKLISYSVLNVCEICNRCSLDHNHLRLFQFLWKVIPKPHVIIPQQIINGDKIRYILFRCCGDIVLGISFHFVRSWITGNPSRDASSLICKTSSRQRRQPTPNLIISWLRQIMINSSKGMCGGCRSTEWTGPDEPFSDLNYRVENFFPWITMAAITHGWMILFIGKIYN